MKNILLIHQHRPHFEVILGLQENLKQNYNLYLWSDSLDMFDRKSALEFINLPLYQNGLSYDFAVVISGDVMPVQNDIPFEIWKLINTTPTARILHRFEAPEEKGAIFLFPKASVPFIPVSTGLEKLKAEGSVFPQRRSLLVQGNIEPRRNYSLLSRISEACPAIELAICGLRVGDQILESDNLKPHFNLNELDFHRLCANSSFIAPLLDPVRFKNYFEDRFTSSIQIGLSYNLPFIAHKALFDLYPIVGLSYETDEEFIACVQSACSMSGESYTDLVEKMDQKKHEIAEKNTRNFELVLEAAKPLGGEENLDYFSAYMKEGFDKIEGWPGTKESVLFLQKLNMLFDYNQEYGGGACEIGVHHCKYLIALHNLLGAKKSLGIDLFDDQSKNIDFSGRGSQSICKENILKYAQKPDNITLMGRDSLALSEEDLNEIIRDHGRFAIFSIDGGHTPLHLSIDFSTATKLTLPSGIIIVDDIFHPDWPGVTEGVYRVLLARSSPFVPLFLTRKKLFLCHLSTQKKI